MKRLDVALASCLELPEPDPDARPLGEALEAAGLRAEVRAWDDGSVDWAEAHMTLLRTTWNYPERPRAFADWLESTAAVSEMWNPLPIVRWNLNKRYLLWLEERGVAAAPTEWVARGSHRPLAGILAARGWGDAAIVIKPAVSAASYRTIRVDADLERGEAHLEALLEAGDVLVQPYVSSVEREGERSLVWVAGELTHAVRKSPRFSGEDESVAALERVSEAESDLARRAIELVRREIHERLLYARVDLAFDQAGEPVIMELELIEPSLFLPYCPPAARRLAAAVCDLLGRA